MKLLIVVDVRGVDPAYCDPREIAEAVLCDDAEWLGERTSSPGAEFEMLGAEWEPPVVGSILASAVAQVCGA